MPDQNRSVEEELNNKVDLLERAFIRERNAKRTLEKKLEDKKEDKFNQNKELLTAFESATSRQLQLQFLSSLTQDLLFDKDIEDMINNFISNLSNLLEHCPVIKVTITDKTSRTISTCASPLEKWKKQPWLDSYNQDIDEMFQQEEAVWHRHELDLHETYNPFFKLMDNTTLLYLVFTLSKSQKRIICLDINHYCYGEDFKQTLNIAGKQFASVIKRRITEVELSYNYQVLRNTVAELKSTQKQLVHSEKMASLGQLAAGVAHEINNPIGYVNSNLDVLKSYIEVYEKTLNTMPEQSAEFLNTRELAMVREDVDSLIDACIGGVDRVSEIVKSLKTFSRKEADDYTELNINLVVESALKIVWNQIKYNYQVHQNLHEPMPFIMGNHGQLQQVFVNLLVNAVDAMGEKGDIVIISKDTEEAIEVSVSDNGCGMEQAVIKRLFEPFYTTKEQHKGTGLGLSVSYAIIEKHNAHVSVVSEPSEGTTFTLKFPKL